MIRSLLAISAGASAGAIMRWGFGLLFNRVFPAIPPGTWLANMLGAYLAGVALALFALSADIPAEWRLFIVTGFLGGLTTFSTFSAEVFVLLQQGRVWLACIAVAAHVLGALFMTFLGYASVAACRSI